MKKKKKIAEWDLHPLAKDLFFAKMKAAEKQADYLAAKVAVQDVKINIAIEKILLAVKIYWNESMEVQKALQILKKKNDQ